MLFLQAPLSIRRQILFHFACGLCGFLLLWGLEYAWIGSIGYGEGMNSIASLDAYRHFYAAGPGRWDVGLIVNYSGPLLMLWLSCTLFMGVSKLTKGKLSKADFRDFQSKLGLSKLIIPGALYLVCLGMLLLLILGVQAFGPLTSFIALKVLLTIAMFGALVAGADAGLIAGALSARGSPKSDIGPENSTTTP